MAAIFHRVVQNATRFPGKLAIIESHGETLTYAQLLRRIEKTVNFLHQNIVPSKSRVAVCIHEGIDIPVVVLSLNALKLSVIPINPGFQPKQINSLLKSVNADVIIIDSTTIHLSTEIHSSVTVIDLSLSDKVAVTKKISDYNSVKFGNYNQFLITLSSGSTGNPKPIILSEKNKMDRFAQAVDLYNITEKDVVLCASPFFHSLGQRLTLLPLFEGATLVQLTRFTSKSWLDVVTTNKVTFTIPVSSHLHALVELLLSSSELLTSLRCLVSSSAAINYEIKKRLIDLLSCDFREIYGTSEIAIATDLTKEQAASKSESVGLPCPGVKVRVLDEKLNNCDSNQVGQIAVKSPLTFTGYYKLPELTDNSFFDDYFLTGDLGYLDKDNYLYFVDRKKDIIITGGMNIYPSDIENVMFEHPKISSCVALGIYDSYLGEATVVVAVCEGDERLVEREVKSLLKKRLAAYQLPMKFFFRKHLPLSATGKIDKVSLRKELNALKLDISAKLRALQK